MLEERFGGRRIALAQMLPEIGLYRASRLLGFGNAACPFENEAHVVVRHGTLANRAGRRRAGRAEALPLLYAKEGVSGHFDVGEYWDRAVQIDVVGLRADGWVDLGEQGRVGVAQAARELAVRATHFPAGSRTVRQILFVRKRSKPDLQGTIVHDLTALYEWQ